MCKGLKSQTPTTDENRSVIPILSTHFPDTHLITKSQVLLPGHAITMIAMNCMSLVQIKYSEIVETVANPLLSDERHDLLVIPRVD